MVLARHPAVEPRVVGQPRLRAQLVNDRGRVGEVGVRIEPDGHGSGSGHPIAMRFLLGWHVAPHCTRSPRHDQSMPRLREIPKTEASAPIVLSMYKRLF